MFNFRLAQEFRKRAAEMIGPFPRGAVATFATASTRLENGRIGAYAALGAIGLGGVMLMANIAHNRSVLPVAELLNNSPSVASEGSKATVAKRAPTPEVDVTPIAVTPAAPVATPLAATAKSTVRVDTSTTGAIAAATPTHPKHKPRPKKTKDLDSHN